MMRALLYEDVCACFYVSREKSLWVDVLSLTKPAVRPGEMSYLTWSCRE